MQRIAVILAGGTGIRFGTDIPKQMLHVQGKPIIWHAIRAFVRSDFIDRVVVVCHVDIMDEVQKMCADFNAKSIDIIRGGKYARLDSTYEAVRFLQNICADEDKILFHDAVRPMVSLQIIQDCIYALDPHDAITVGVPVIDTLMHIQGGIIGAVPNRADYMRMQTPQGFRFHVINDAYAVYDPQQDSHHTDDCGFVMAKLPHIQVGIVLGDENNLKITTPKDLKIVETI